MRRRRRPNDGIVNGHPARLGPRSRLAGIILFTAVAAICCRCTPEQRYRTLTFFFDGVPDPNAPKDPVVDPNADTPYKGGPRGPRTASNILSVHKPYKEGKCEECHGGGRVAMALAVDSRGICRKCHEDFGREWTFTHGPVAAWACAACHTPHESKLTKLLLRPADELCERCHDPEVATFKASDKGHASGDPCSDCHMPHGAMNRFLLRE